MKIELMLAAGLCLAAPGTWALEVEGADGSDGALVVSSETVIYMDGANTGNWKSAPTVPGSGVYDPEKWAVVYKYSSVTINGGPLRFYNHPSRAPVVWLVSGDVTIGAGGSIVLDGVVNNPANYPSEPGPGGFRGGAVGGPGFGPGGGQPGYSARFGDSRQDSTESTLYGDPSLEQLIGGSGGGSDPGAGGGSGGGAILIVATGRITINGSITARGAGFESGRGSGGGIRLVAEELIGNNATIYADGGHPNGGRGRIALQAKRFEGQITTIPEPYVTGINGNAARIWPELPPKARIVSVGGVAASADPRGSIANMFVGAGGIGTIRFGRSDVTLLSGVHTVVIETENFPPTGVVRLYRTHSRLDRTSVLATHKAGDFAQSTWEASVDLTASGGLALQVHAVAAP